MYFQVESSRFLGKLRRNMLRESNDETRDPHLSANVEKLRQNSLDQMAISQYALQLACGGLLLRIAILLANFGQVREIDHRCNREGAKRYGPAIDDHSDQHHRGHEKRALGRDFGTGQQ